ncbi:MAG: CoA pyrophosphatase [Gemmatimonadota bacterium]
MDLARARQVLAAHAPALLAPADRLPCAVALVLRQGAAGVELLYIERARQEGDPWSGHLAFPGGRLEAADAGPRQAAERETREEVDLDLSAAEYLGRLDDVTAAGLTVVVSGYAYALADAPPVLTLSPEVQSAFWVPLGRLLEPERQRLEVFPVHGGQRRRLPAVDLLGPGRPLLWGVTYRFTARLLELVGVPLPGSGEGASPP